MDLVKCYKKFQGKSVKIVDIDGQIFEGIANFGTDYETDRDYITVFYPDKNYANTIFGDEIASIELI